jgi:hypothetical protein
MLSVAKTPANCTRDHLFVKVKFCGQNVLIGLIYNPSRVPGNPIFGHLCPRYTHSLLLDDLNVDLLVDSARFVALRDMLEDVSLIILSREATNFSPQVPTLIDVCATFEPESIECFTQIALPEKNTQHDLIY